MTILTYKGYQASVDYEDGHLVIQLLHVDDFISTIGDDAREVEKAFHKLVDEYLETCRQLGREPKKPYKGSLNIRMPPELHRRTAMAASSANVSLNAWIVTACQEKLASIESLRSGHEIPGDIALTEGDYFLPILNSALEASAPVALGHSFGSVTSGTFASGANAAHDLVVMRPYRNEPTGRMHRFSTTLTNFEVREDQSAHWLKRETT